MNTSDLIQPRHLIRRAAVYVRQSSPHQVLHNQESQKIQYALRERARQLGRSARELSTGTERAERGRHRH